MTPPTAEMRKELALAEAVYDEASRRLWNCVGNTILHDDEYNWVTEARDERGRALLLADPAYSSLSAEYHAARASRDQLANIHGHQHPSVTAMSRLLDRVWDEAVRRDRAFNFREDPDYKGLDDAAERRFDELCQASIGFMALHADYEAAKVMLDKVSAEYGNVDADLAGAG